MARCVFRSLPALLLVCAACFSAEAARRELDHSAFLFHRDVRWYRCSFAAVRVDEELRAAFTAQCGDLEGRLNVEAVEILDVEMSESNEEAIIRVRYTFLQTPSLALEKALVSERWVKQGGEWRIADGLWPIPIESPVDE